MASKLWLSFDYTMTSHFINMSFQFNDLYLTFLRISDLVWLSFTHLHLFMTSADFQWDQIFLSGKIVTIFGFYSENFWLGNLARQKSYSRFSKGPCFWRREGTNEKAKNSYAPGMSRGSASTCRQRGKSKLCRSVACSMSAFPLLPHFQNLPSSIDPCPPAALFGQIFSFPTSSRPFGLEEKMTNSKCEL